MDNLYLSPQQPQVPITTEAQLRSAAESGHLRETHHLELKREVGTSTAAKKELARDLASLAVDGGTLLVGVGEAGPDQVQLVPQPLSGMAERIEQVAFFRPDPPLAVVAREIVSEADPALGYLVVHVPTSPSMPHMVEGSYFGRGDRTKHVLSDTQVVALHARRLATRASINDAVQAEIDRDPAHDLRVQAHLFIVAVPINSRGEAFADYLYADDRQNRLFALLRSPDATSRLAAAGVGGISPSFGDMQTHEARPDGAAMSNYRMGPGRTLRQGAERNEGAAEVEFRTDGSVRVFCGRLSDALGRGEPSVQMLFEDLLLTYVVRTLTLVQAIAEITGHFGEWDLGLGANGLSGVRSYKANDTFRDGTQYSVDDYRRTTTTSYPELTKSIGAVTERLVGSLLRTLGSHHLYTTLLAETTLTPEDSHSPSTPRR